LLKHRRDGIAGEVSGRRAAASFYFDECVAQLKSRGPEHQVWQWLTGECAKSGFCMLPGEMYRTFIDELSLICIAACDMKLIQRLFNMDTS